MAKGRKLEKYVQVNQVGEGFVVLLHAKKNVMGLSQYANQSITLDNKDAAVEFANQVAQALKLKVVGVEALG